MCTDTSGKCWNREFSPFYLGMHEMCNAAYVCSFKINWIFPNTLEMNNNSSSSHSRRSSRSSSIELESFYWNCCIVLGYFVCFRIYCVHECVALHLFYWLHAEYFFQFITRNRERTQRKQLIRFFCCVLFFPRHISCYLCWLAIGWVCARVSAQFHTNTQSVLIATKSRVCVKKE